MKWLGADLDGIDWNKVDWTKVEWTAECVGLRNAGHEIPQFCETYRNWLGTRSSPFEILIALPKVVLSQLAKRFGCDQEEVDAETAFANICNGIGAIGLCGDEPVAFPWLRPEPANAEVRALMTAMGVDAETSTRIDFALKTPIFKDLHRRMQAVLGRLLSDPEFIKDRDGLQAVWQEITVERQPAFPILEPVRLQAKIEGLDLRRATRLVQKFAEELVVVCKRWQIHGFASWSLPLPNGPLLPAMTGNADDEPSTFVIPWTFPIKTKDGIGAIAAKDHERRAAERGIEDHSHWASYAGIFQVTFWDAVLQDRFGDKDIADIQTRIDATLCEILNLDEERIRKLRKWHRALLAGKITSLTGRR